MSISQDLMMPETTLVLAYRERTPADRIYLEERSKESTQEWDRFENMYDVHIHLIHIMYIDIKWYIYIVYSYNYTYALYQPLMLSCSTYLRSPGSPGPQIQDVILPKMQVGRESCPRKKREVLHFKTSVNRIYGGYITDISIDSIVRWFQTLEIQFLLYDVWYISTYFNYLGQNPQWPILQKAAPKEIET